MTACFGRRCLAGDKEPFTFPEGEPSLSRRRFVPLTKEHLPLIEGAFGRKEKRSEKEDELPLRSVTVPDEGT